MFAIGKGNIRIQALVGDKLIQHEIKNVLHVPDCPKNLFSVGTTADKGLVFQYDQSTVRILNKKKEVEAVGIRENASDRMYKMLFIVSPPNLRPRLQLGSRSRRAAMQDSVMDVLWERVIVSRTGVKGRKESRCLVKLFMSISVAKCMFPQLVDYITF